MHSATEQTAGSIVLFDGVCNLCNGAVQFIIRRDRRRQFRFASLQSETGQERLRQMNLPTAAFSTFVLSEGGKVYTRSTAALRIARRLPGAWPLLYAFVLIPRPVRDWVYDLVARCRYRLFGRQDSCMMPTPELKGRFLDS
jgi:predicted DCC family thiol-disulfide oxidoreductase YuxK